MAPPFVKRGATVLSGLRGLAGFAPTVCQIELSFSPLNIDAYSENSTINSAHVTVVPVAKHRGEVFLVRWAQVSGIAGVASDPTSLRTRFEFSGLSVANYQQVWRAFVTNNYGEAGVIDVNFVVARYYPALGGSGSPGAQVVAIDPSTRSATVYFSAAGSGGVPPYSYNWGGGDNPLSASNQATFTLPPGTTSYNFAPGCTITDGVGQSIVVGAGPFLIYEA
jgi:hypothetical protein